LIEAFDFNFKFSSSNLAVGNAAKVGDNTYFKVSGEGFNQAVPLTFPSECFGEVAGLEIFPGKKNGLWQHYDAVKLIIGGKSFNDQVFNELTAPGLAAGYPDPLGAVGLRYGAMPINFGMPMLLGGRPEEACPKIAPGQSVEIEVTAPPTAEGGATLDQDMKVRLWVAKVQGVQKLKDTLKFQSAYTKQGYYDGNVVNCNFDFGDLEVHEKLPVRTTLTNNPIKNPIPETGSFDPADHWSKLPGGVGQDKPTLHVFSVFAKQMADTSVNEYYQFVTHSQQVQDKSYELYWDFKKGDALKITHLGFKQPAVGTINYMWLRRSGREIETIYDAQSGSCPFSMPRERDPNTFVYAGPTKLPKPFIVWNEIASIEIKDNATAVDGWSSLNANGAGVYVRGVRYEFNEKEV
jgi:hypothetical protein